MRLPTETPLKNRVGSRDPFTILRRIQPSHLILGSLSVLAALWLWWALSGDSRPDEDPLTPSIETPSQGDPIPILSEPFPVPGTDREARLGTPVTEPAAPTVKLIVRVVDSKGVMIPTANVGITNALGNAIFSIRRPNKQHEFPGLAPGKWSLMTYAVGYCDQDRELELIDEGKPIELEIKLEDASLFPIRFLTPAGEDAVEVLNALENSPLSGSDLYAVATRSRPEATLPRMAPGARPQYGVGLFHATARIMGNDSPIPQPGPGYAGVLELKQPPPVFISAVLRETVLETIEVSTPGSRNIIFTVVPELLQAKLSSATVVVLDASTREPIEGVEVTCDDANIADSGQDGSAIDSDGRVTFKQRFPGWVTVCAMAPGYEIFQASARLEPGSQNDLGTIYLEPELTLTGRVENTAGQGVRSVFYARDLGWQAGEGPPGIGHTLGSSGSDGTLTLNRLGRREYRIHVTSPGYAPKLLDLDLSRSLPESLEVVLEPGIKTVLASRYDADLTHRVSLYDPSGRLCFSEFIPGKRSRDTWLAPGEYELVLHHGPRELSRRTIEITTESAVHDLRE